MIRAIFALWVLVLSASFVPSSHALITPQEKMEWMKATLAADQSVGKRLGDYELIDSSGERFHLSEFYHKPFIIHFIYTRCIHTCATITSNLATALREAEVNPGEKVNIFTVGFDDEMDTPQGMKEFGERFTGDFGRWRFVTANKEVLERLTGEIGFYYKKTGDGFDHLNMITIIDSGGKIYKHIYGTNITGNDVLLPLKELLENKKEGRVLRSSDRWIDRLIYLCSSYEESTQTYRINYLYILIVLLQILSFFVFIIFIWKRDLCSFYHKMRRA